MLIKFIKQFSYSLKGWDNNTIEKNTTIDLENRMAKIAIDNDYAVEILAKAKENNKQEDNRPITLIKGLGKATEKKINVLGINTIEEFKRATKEQIKAMIDIKGVSENDLLLWNEQINKGL